MSLPDYVIAMILTTRGMNTEESRAGCRFGIIHLAKAKKTPKSEYVSLTLQQTQKKFHFLLICRPGCVRWTLPDAQQLSIRENEQIPSNVLRIIWKGFINKRSPKKLFNFYWYSNMIQAI